MLNVYKHITDKLYELYNHQYLENIYFVITYMVTGSENEQTYV